ncbi:hypothetical protein [Nocardioides gilvus]|uniref:hypothetical protein n=1 Tax=Nocardioides gilvus TaxID=1735589 RepID=UPI000D74A85E|nr:hypothetical protein [Nocardioides gilvus]
MGMFTARSKQRSADAVRSPATPMDTPGDMGFPVEFEAVGEALVVEECPLASCEATGRVMAADGASVDEALFGLRATWQLVRGQDPDFEATVALARAWGEETLSHVNQLSCEDPLTGLASLPHVRTIVAGLYRAEMRGGAHPRDSHALVVVDLLALPGARPPRDPFGGALRLMSLGESAQAVFGRAEVIARLTPQRIVVLALRESRLGVRVRLLRRLIEGMELDGYGPRIWIEGLPASETASRHLLDELARR